MRRDRGRAGQLLLLALPLGCGGAEVKVSGDFFEVGTTDPIVGAQICLYDEDPCVTTGDDGHFDLTGVPAEEEVAISADAGAAYPKGLTFLRTTTADEDIGRLVILTKAAADLAAAAVDLSLDYSRGHLALSFTKERALGSGVVPGIEVSADLSSGLGPYYLNEASLPDLTQTQTSSGGGAVFLNVLPGDVSVEIDGPTPCEPWLSWGETDHARARVVAGYFSAVVLACP